MTHCCTFLSQSQRSLFIIAFMQIESRQYVDTDFGKGCCNVHTRVSSPVDTPGAKNPLPISHTRDMRVNQSFPAYAILHIIYCVCEEWFLQGSSYSTRSPVECAQSF